ncbi:L-aspartate oxidase [Lottiidibacillus patelloidae]|uniref:L-aspartate oxidase n=2 Tax=Lottiidibacillus patelloidae TaxID=2670334 RepID=A0A263BW99_9BACI|nr:L-aspartate oxidase [Lottiidibacillus patelloidae]OZM58013.1 L-aspartate oxidase [Lottiidibacillus patelloidae]
MKTADVIVIGAGIAGLVTALQLAKEKKVIVIAKGNLTECNSNLAQGGIAAVTTKQDSFASHFIDTITAGDFHNEEELTKTLIKNGPDAIRFLKRLGVPFDENESGELALCKEGNHSHSRILHAGGDATGHEIMEKLRAQLKENVSVIENEMAMDLLMENEICVGVWTKDLLGKKTYYFASTTVLATGGLGQLYEVTSNAKSATGDGIAMAYRAGAQLADMEFVQFHPTMLIKDGKGNGLISEAVRGEGATLINKNKQALMEGVHPLKDLAPRDVVAREIFFSMKKGEEIFLDISKIPDFQSRFPTITAQCLKNNIDIERESLPVAPGAHFMMGGVKTNEFGETSIPRLYAVGEVACTGVHGANRLASNSLLEGIVFAKLAASAIKSQSKLRVNTPNQPSILITKLQLPNKRELQKVMSENVGIVRNENGLRGAKQWFERFLLPINEDSAFDLPLKEMTMVNMLTTGWLIATSALERNESRGAHYRDDFIKNDNNRWLKRQIVRSRRDNDGQFLCEGKTKNIFSRRYKWQRFIK